MSNISKPLRSCSLTRTKSSDYRFLHFCRHGTWVHPIAAEFYYLQSQSEIMTHYVLRFIRPSSGIAGFLSKNRELNLIYVDEALTHNTIVTQDETLAKYIYDQRKGFIHIEPWISFVGDLMSYLDEAMPGDDKMIVEQFLVIDHGGYIELKKTISLVGL